MSDGKCTKQYPINLLAETINENNRYPHYRRRSSEYSGKIITLKVRNNFMNVDNHWFVPYWSSLSKTYKAQINVEYCNALKSIKYICKYVNKGSDIVVFEVEIKVEKQLIVEKQKFVHLDLHLENEQRVCFTTENVRALSPHKKG